MKLWIRWNAGSKEGISRHLPSDLPDDTPFFHSLEIDQSSKSWPLLGSLAGHIAVVAIVTLLSQNMAWLGYEEIDWSRYREEPAPLRLRLSHPLYFASKQPAPVPRRGRKPAAEPIAASASLKAPAAPVRSGPPVPRRLELPVARAAAQDAPVILQPDFLPQPPPVNLPPLAFWARRSPEAPKPPTREEVDPGRTEAPTPLPKLAAQPVIAVPNRETTVAEVNVAMPPTPAPQQPALSLPNSATSPIRLRDATESKTGSIEAEVGQPVNVMALSTERRDIRNVEIARGLQNIPNFSVGDSGTAAGRGAAPSPDSNSVNIGANGRGLSPRPDMADGGRGGTTGNPSASEAMTATAAAGDRPSTSPAGTLISRPIASPEVTRIEHPTNGNFDVVVMQSATRDDLPEMGGMLTGNPVYSVYLRVGDHKEWLLEYCVPTRETAQLSPYQVNLDEAGAITPPYPISTVIPSNLLGQHGGKQIILHGLLTAAGSFQGIKSRDNHNPMLPQLLTLLNQWQFRPALRNKKPIDVEIVLVIPPRG